LNVIFTYLFEGAFKDLGLCLTLPHASLILIKIATMGFNVDVKVLLPN
jgi:hypothetical protein